MENEEVKENPRRMGRPLKYRDLEELESKIQTYFDSCFGYEWKDEEIRDDITGDPVLDENGKIKKRHKKVKVQIEPITITGLAMALDTSRRTLIDYERREDTIPDICNAIKKAKDFCEHCVEKGMIVGSIHPTVGIFNLKSNYKWEDKIELDVNDNRRKVEEISEAMKRIAGE